MAEKSGLTKRDCETALNAAMEAITESVARKENVILTGFGTFSVRHRDARTGINPRTGEKIQMEASDVPVFKAGALLKDAAKQ